MMIAYALVALLIAATGLMVATDPRVAEFYAVALFVTGTAVIVLIAFAAYTA